LARVLETTISHYRIIEKLGEGGIAAGAGAGRGFPL